MKTVPVDSCTLLRSLRPPFVTFLEVHFGNAVSVHYRTFVYVLHDVEMSSFHGSFSFRKRSGDNKRRFVTEVGVSLL